VKELNKAIQDLKVEVETIKETQMEANLEMENLGKRSGITDVSITNRIQEIEERIPDVEDTIEENNITVKENSKHKKLLTQDLGCARALAVWRVLWGPWDCLQSLCPRST
jgi:predicted  nucleic acid-binding Zn-ribbon protein